MGIHPDRAISPPDPARALTLGEMAAQTWEMAARCGRCRVTLSVSVAALVTLHGPDAIWWGRAPKCRVMGCEGRVTFIARSHEFGSWRALKRLSPGELERYRTYRR